MADASQLAADLFAALGASPFPDPSPGPNPDTDPKHGPDAPPHFKAEPAADASRLTESNAVSPPPSLSQAPAAVLTPPPNPTGGAAAAHAPQPTPAPLPASDKLAAIEPAPEVLSPPHSQLAQSLAQALEPAGPNAALPPHPQSASVSASPATLGACSPKRPRSPDGEEGLDGGSIKRLKTEHAEPKQQENGVEASSNLDLAAILDEALAGFDQQANLAGNHVAMQDVDRSQPAGPASTTSELEKLGNKIMKASRSPFYVMRSMSLPLLGNVAVQILLRLSQQPHAETASLLADADSDFRKAYDMLLDIFRPTRRAFSDSPLLSPDKLDIADSEDRETIRMSNLAATAASVFGAHDVSLQDVHDAFFSIFIPEDGEYKSSLTALLLCLKTRLLLDALNKPEQPQPVSPLLDALFPVDFDSFLKQRSGDSLLNPEEEALVSQMRERRELLVKSAADEPIKKYLETESSAERFAESLSSFLQGHLGVVVDYADRYGVNIPLNDEETATVQDANNAHQEGPDSLAALLQSATSHLAPVDGEPGQGKDVSSYGLPPEQAHSMEDDNLALKRLLEQSLSGHVPESKAPPAGEHASAGAPSVDSKDLASFISDSLKNNPEIPAHGLSNLPSNTSGLAGSNTAPMHPQYVAQLSHMSHTHPSPYPTYTQGSASAPAVGAGAEVLPPNQSMPTAALYERARQAAVAKSSNTTRREGLHSARRPWTPEEEKALMAGLDMVKGPHWSQILSLFGPNGTISDILKDRSQVQLKDKARNLKLFFLKTNSEMPYYLQSVTGELKTRAPSQAARKEAEEKARMNLEEEQARIQGIMTLAGGLQNNHQGTPSTPLAASPAKRPQPATAGVGGGVPGATTAAAHTGSNNGAALSAVPTAPRTKVEAPDHHSLARIPAFPPIQPAPGPGPGVQQAARSHLPALQPQQPKPAVHQQPYQQLHEVRPQEAPKVPMQAAQQQQQQRPPRPQHQHPQLQQQQQQQQQQQAVQPQTPHQHRQQQQQQQQMQAKAQTVPQPPAQTQAAPPPPQTPSQAQQQPPPPPPQQQQQQQQPPVHTSPRSANANTNTNNQTSTSANAHPSTQPLPTPPIPPNHHSTPDHAQDTKLFESLQAAIAASSAPSGTAEGSTV
ncbi:800ed3a9-cfc5-4660-93de-41cb5bae1a85 [Thermothielavioides terrestris]|uniref:800ed3a9-cfc5-4660-93de-41cb5bae1a85 n=1 Tax=Thermothielavioides terrestris TaxID=2587410 RepID=A0A3S4EZT4_9PEZI|nr:800ed3a9-cfc5-4660-93de-41cb5bae1a85 [Thermothielavioides terrestris]